jgi:hypothetical protein
VFTENDIIEMGFTKTSTDNINFVEYTLGNVKIHFRNNAVQKIFVNNAKVNQIHTLEGLKKICRKVNKPGH